MTDQKILRWIKFDKKEINRQETNAANMNETLEIYKGRERGGSEWENKFGLAFLFFFSFLNLRHMTAPCYENTEAKSERGLLISKT